MREKIAWIMYRSKLYWVIELQYIESNDMKMELINFKGKLDLYLAEEAIGEGSW